MGWIFGLCKIALRMRTFWLTQSLICQHCFSYPALNALNCFTLENIYVVNPSVAWVLYSEYEVPGKSMGCVPAKSMLRVQMHVFAFGTLLFEVNLVTWSDNEIASPLYRKLLSC